MVQGILAFLLALAAPSVTLNTELTTTSHRSHTGLRVSHAPQVDGDLSDEVWRQAKPVQDLVQRFPNPGSMPTFETQIWIVYDQQALYIAAHCSDPQPDQIIARVTRRDRWVESDWFKVELDSRRDLRSGYFFVVNAAGVQVDGVLYDENQENTDWDGVWEAQSRVVEDGWDVEMKIPLHLLRYSTGQQIEFGANFSRHISRLNELNQWQYIAPESNLRVSRFGVLSDLDLKERNSHIELSPYVVYRLDVDSGQFNNQGFDNLDAGLDGKVGLGSNFMLTMTANPDFGQVELDQVVLNLSTIETYFPEKRPFFLSDKFMFMMPAFGDGPKAELFYSRRIGQLRSQPTLEDDQEVVTPARAPRIYGAAKVAGVTDRRLSIGLMQAVTSQEQALIENADGSRIRKQAEQLTSYSVMRLNQAFGNNSEVGMMATATVAPDAGTALTGGTNLQWELFDGRYNLTVLTHFSYLTQERFELQDDFTKSALQNEGAFGYGGNAIFRKKGGEHLVGAIGGSWRSPSLALNDVGYLDRANTASAFVWLQFRHLRPLGPIASIHVNTNAWLFRNTSGLKLNDGVNINGDVTFLNNLSLGGIVGLDTASCDDRETRTQGRIVVCHDKAKVWSGLWASTDKSKMLSASLQFNWSQNYQGHAYRTSIPIQFNPAAHLQFELVPGYYFTKGKIRFLDTTESSTAADYLFGDQHWEYWDITFRSTLNFGTLLSLQAYAQVFLAAVDYRQKYAWTEESGQTRIDFTDLVFDKEIEDDFDFTSANLNLGMVLRWEYSPGSVAYLVYTGRFGNETEIPEFRFGNVLSDLLSQTADHVLMFKLSYFWA